MTQNADSVPPSLGFDILMTMEVAVLRRLGPRRYQFCGLAPYFYIQLFPQEDDGSNCASPWHYSPMLEYFLDEVETFFNNEPEPGAHISSGIWVEDLDGGEGLPLAATARVMKDERVLLIQAIREEHTENARILRQARGDLAGRGKVSAAISNFKKKSLYDQLTKLYNRNTFLDILQNQISNMHSYTPNLALLVLDIDDFQKINDSRNHSVGDLVLTKIAQLLKGALRKNDTPVRYGGEEFAVIAPNTSLPQSMQVGEKLRQCIEGHDFDTDMPLTVSVGCTIYRPGESSKDFIARAFLALGDAKRQGKNTICQRDPWTLV